jgi:hypothetical protein
MADLHDRINSAVARMGDLEDEDVAEESLTFEFVQLFCRIFLKVNVSPHHRTQKEYRVYQNMPQCLHFC